MPVSPARAAAFEILMRIETTDAYASELLHSNRFAKLSATDHGLLTELLMGVLRWRTVLDEAIGERLIPSSFPFLPKPGRSGAPSDPVNARPVSVEAGRTRAPHSRNIQAHTALNKLDLEVLTALRLGAYQLLFLDRVPRHAAVNESVELVKRARKRSAAGLVNAVLRKIDQQDFKLEPRAAHPRWLVERWERIYGVDVARRICEYDQAHPEITIRTPRPSKNPKNGAGAAWDGSGSVLADSIGESIQLTPGRLLAYIAIVSSGDITRTTEFREHRLTIQDEASQLVALLLGKGERILDCCAAPGGKTRILAEQNPDATIIAMELHPRRAALLKKFVPDANVRIIAADARTMPFCATFDRILVDAPCSGTGTLARNPEIKWRLTSEDIVRLRSYQIEILRSAMMQIAHGGRLVYSTCSLEPEENEIVVEKALKDDDSFRVLNCRDELQRLQARGELAWNDIESLVSGPYLRTIPGVHPCDGFFAAILERE